MPSEGNYRLTADKITEETLKKAGLSFNDLSYTIATGYGSSSVSFSNNAVTDVSCQGRGISHLLPSVRTTVDIGNM